MLLAGDSEGLVLVGLNTGAVGLSLVVSEVGENSGVLGLRELSLSTACASTSFSFPPIGAA